MVTSSFQGLFVGDSKKALCGETMSEDQQVKYKNQEVISTVVMTTESPAWLLTPAWLSIHNRNIN